MVSKNKIAKFLNKIHLPHWLTILLAVVLILRIPSFFEPFSYGDEMIYLTLGEAIRRGVPLYKGIHDNKPPLLYILAAIAGSLFWFKVILAAWSLATIVLFWKLSQTLFPKRTRLQKLATIIFAILTTIPLLEGNIANAELFMIGPIIAAFLVLLSKKLNPKNLFISGVLFSLATLFKVPAAFDMPTIVFLWLVGVGLKTKNLKKVAKNTGYLALGFIAPIALTFVWYALRGALSEYATAAFLQNFGYLSSWRPGDVKEPFLTKNGPLLIRAGIVAIGLAILYWKRKKISKQFIFLTTWLLFSLFAITLSERPYPHYLIQAVPAISFFFAILFTNKSLEQSLTIIPLSLAFFVPVYFKFWYYPTASYYVRFVRFSVGQMSRESYLRTFGNHVPRDYEIAEFITQSTERGDKIFVWGGDAVIYALSRRLPPIKYVANYHINDYSSKEEVARALAKDKPKLIVLLPEASSFPQIIPLLRESYILISTFDSAEIWIQISPEVQAKLLLSAI